MSWQAQLVAHLRHSKSAGLTFPNAWALAVQTVRVPTQADYTPTLFDTDAMKAAGHARPATDRPEETVLTSFRRFCEAAYTDRVGPVGSGNGPSLRFFSTGMLDDVRLEPVAA